MPVKTRAKAAARARLPSQFGELETTPTSHHQSTEHSPTAQRGSGLPLSSPRRRGSLSRERYDDGFDDLSLGGLDDMQQTPSEIRRHSSFQWSETESLARRSSPLNPGETPKTIWQFDGDGSLPPLSTPASAGDKLPDTAPLPSGPSAVPEREAVPTSAVKVDFSETASTMRRSSPVGLGDPVKDILDFSSSCVLRPSPGSSPKDSTHQATRHDNGGTHVPLDNIYDATPSPINSRRHHSPGQEVTATSFARDVFVSAPETSRQL